MSQYIYTMNGVSKTVPPKRQIIKDISLSFFPGAKIGLLGLNGAGKSTVLKIMAGVDHDFVGEARPQAGIKVGYLAQEPQLDPTHTVREAVEQGVGEVLQAQAALDKVYEAYAEEGADFDKLAAEQQRLEAILASGDAHTLEHQLEVAADALRLPPWDAKIGGHFQLALQGMRVVGGQDVLQLLLLFGQLVEVRAFLGVGGVDLFQALLRVEDLRNAFFHRFADGLLRIQLRFLGQIADLGARVGARLALEVGIDAGHDLEHRGLARAVQAQQADLGAGEERERDVLDDLAFRGNDLAHPVHREDVLHWGSAGGRGRPALDRAAQGNSGWRGL